jgi:hypothetical protein
VSVVPHAYSTKQRVSQADNLEQSTHTGWPPCTCCLRQLSTESQWRTQEIFFSWGGSTNTVEDRGQKERGSGGGSHLVRSSTQFANE